MEKRTEKEDVLEIMEGIECELEGVGGDLARIDMSLQAQTYLALDTETRQLERELDREMGRMCFVPKDESTWDAVKDDDLLNAARSLFKAADTLVFMARTSFDDPEIGKRVRRTALGLAGKYGFFWRTESGDYPEMEALAKNAIENGKPAGKSWKINGKAHT